MRAVGKDDAAKALEALGGADAPAEAAKSAQRPAAAPAPATSKPAAPTPGKSGHGGARPGSGPKPKAGKEPTAEEVAAAEEARRDARRRDFAANEKNIKAALADFYGMPFDLLAAFSDVAEVKLDAETKRARGDTAYWVVYTFCPDWTKYLPLILLGGCFVGDVGVAVKLIQEDRARRKAAEGARGPTSPAPAAVVAQLDRRMPAPAAPEGAPPPVRAG